MNLVVITPPSESPVTLDMAKTQLGITNNNQDDFVKALIDAATAALDGPAGWLGRALMPQTLELSLDGFGPGWCLGYMPYGLSSGYWTQDLPCVPVTSITSVKYIDTSGNEQTVDASSYWLEAGTLHNTYGYSFPRTRSQSAAVKIRYVAGYANATAVPAPIKQAIILSVRHLYALAKRDLFISESTVDGVSTTRWVVSDVASKIINDAAERLLSPYKVRM